ncbi:MAG TPA: hypothetical protein VFG74_00160 [Miltoncostaeaceae bacterium]|nr:hypothetical protein [Miltoncostaeaceae bacterium]
MSAAAVVVAAVLLAAACTGGGAAERTGATPPDRLSVTVEGGSARPFRVDLDCAVADRDACAGVIAAAAAADDPGTCSPADGGDRRLRVEGTIDGEPIRAVLERRTDCEIAAYDAAARAAGL